MSFQWILCVPGPELMPLTGVCENKLKNWGPKSPVKWVVRVELSTPFAGGTLMGQGHGLEMQKYWSLGGLAGMA